MISLSAKLALSAISVAMLSTHSFARSPTPMAVTITIGTRMKMEPITRARCTMRHRAIMGSMILAPPASITKQHETTQSAAMPIQYQTAVARHRSNQAWHFAWTVGTLPITNSRANELKSTFAIRVPAGAPDTLARGLSDWATSSSKMQASTVMSMAAPQQSVQ